MSNSPSFRVLVVDDRPEEARALQTVLNLTGEAAVSEPGDVTDQTLSDNDVVLVDYDLSEWEASKDGDEASRSPADGLALAAVLRSRVMPDYHEGRPVAFALHSSQLGRIGGSLSSEVREHAIARVHNLEWVFDKQSDGTAPLAERVREFAAAVRLLPDNWPTEPDEARGTLASLLGWTGAMPGADRAWDHVMRCHAPVHELSIATDGLTCLRWLAHRILPYPCFLYDALHVAVTLGLDPSEVSGDDANPALIEALAPYHYEGVLSHLVGSRWWRAGVDEWVWSLGHGEQITGSKLHSALESAVGCQLRRLDIDDPVVVLDEQYRPSGPVSVVGAVRILPDDWPPFADDAWTTLELALEFPRLRDQVVPDDQDLLDGVSED